MWPRAQELKPLKNCMKSKREAGRKSYRGGWMADMRYGRLEIPRLLQGKLKKIEATLGEEESGPGSR